MPTILRGTTRYRPIGGRRYVYPNDTNPPELPWMCPNTDYAVPVGGTLHDITDTGSPTTNGNNLATAIANAADGDRIRVYPGVRYNLSQVPLPQHSNWVYVYVASKLNGTFPFASSVYHVNGTQTQGQRVTPGHSYAALGSSSPLAQFVLPDDGTHTNVVPLVYTVLGGGGYWWFEGIEWMLEETITTGPYTRGLVELGTTTASTNWFPTAVKDIPNYFNFGHCLFHGNLISTGTPAVYSQGPRRAVQVNAGHVGIRDSSAYYIQVDGSEAQAFGGWDTPGVFSSINNFVAATSQAILFGGSPPYVPGLVMRNFTTKWNHLWKDIRWFRSEGATKAYSCKNHYEHKNGTHILVEDVVMEHNTASGQDGVNILFQDLLDQASSPPANKITDVTMRNIKAYGGGSLIEANGTWSPNTSTPADFTEQPGSRFLFTNLLARDITGTLPESVDPLNGCASLGIQIADSIRDVFIEHCTLEARGVGLIFAKSNSFDADAGTRLTLRNNVIGHGPYAAFWNGDLGTSGITGLNDAIHGGYAFDRNVVYATNAAYADSPGSNPANNTYLSAVSSVGFDANYAADAPSGLSGTSAYKGYATDGGDPGADVAGITAMESAVKSTTLPP